MKKTVLKLGLVFSLVAALLTGCGEPTKSDAKVLKIGSTGQSYPNGFVKDGKLVGFDIELTEAIANELGYKVEWVTAEFGGLMGQLESKRLDTVANAVAVTDARKKQYDFSEPYSFYGSQIVTNTANKDINSLEDLKGKTISGVLGSNHLNILNKRFPNKEVTVRTYETRDGAMYDLVYNRVDGYINSKPILLAEIKRNNLPYKLVGEPLVVEAVAYPFNKTERGEQLRKQFNQAIEKLKAKGVITELSNKYYGADISKP